MNDLTHNQGPAKNFVKFFLFSNKILKYIEHNYISLSFSALLFENLLFL
jgi:hypothetical protein